MPRKRTNTAVWLEKYARWQINVQKDGVRRTFTSSTPGRTGQREANAKADAWLDGQKADPRAKVEDVYPKWISSLKEVTSFEHWHQYESIGRNHILPAIGRVKMDALTEEHLNSVTRNAFKKGMTRKSISNINGCMRAFVKYARGERYTTLVVERLRVPRDAPEGEREVLQPDDIVKLFTVDTAPVHKVLKKDLFINAYRFEAVTGLRPSELIGLKWQDVHADTLYIKRSITRRNVERRGKNDNARRIFDLTELDRKILDDQREFLSDMEIESEFIFPNPDGGHIPQATYYKHWIRYRDNAGITAKASPYELRHTFVSIVKDLPNGMLKSLVGHSKDMDTLGTYGHEIAGERKKAAEMVQSKFEEILSQNKDNNA